MSYMTVAISEVKRQRKLMTLKRKKLGLTLRALGKLSGVSFSTINRFENGKEIELTNYCALFAALYNRSE